MDRRHDLTHPTRAKQMTPEDLSSLIHEITSAKGAIVITADREGIFQYTTYGDINYLEKVGMLSSVQHDIMNEAYIADALVPE